MTIAGPKVQLPTSLSQMFETDSQGNILSLKSEWAQFFSAAQGITHAVSRSGPTGSRPTSSMPWRYVGMPYFDTTLNSPVFLANASSDTWIQPGGVASSIAWGSIIGTLSSQTDLENVLTSKAFVSSLATIATSGNYNDLSNLPTLGTVASTAASTWALAASSYVYQAQIGTVASTAASTWALAASSYVYQAQIGTVASTAASTWALAASSYVYQAQIGSVASTAASTWAIAATTYVYSSTQWNAAAISSLVFNTTRLATTGSAGINSMLTGATDSTTQWTGYSGVATSGAYGSLSGTPTLGTSASTAASTYLFATAQPTLGFVSSYAGATIALGTNVYSTGASVSLTAGTWWLHGETLVGRDVASTTIFTVKITDGTNNFASAQEQIQAIVSTYASIPVGAFVKLGATSTLSIQAAATVSSCFIRAQAWQNAAGSTGTFIQALRIA